MTVKPLPAGGLPIQSCAACVGFFDGMHAGHQRVIRETVRIARLKGVPAVACVLDPPPAWRGAGLTTLSERAKIMEEMGIDWVVTIAFDAATERMAGGRFFDDVLVAGLHARHLVAGEGWMFGRGRSCGARELRVMCNDFGVTLTELTLTREPGGGVLTDDALRAALAAGDVYAAAAMLGRLPDESITARARAGRSRPE